MQHDDRNKTLVLNTPVTPSVAGAAGVPRTRSAVVAGRENPDGARGPEAEWTHSTRAMGRTVNRAVGDSPFPPLPADIWDRLRPSGPPVENWLGSTHAMDRPQRPNEPAPVQRVTEQVWPRPESVHDPSAEPWRAWNLSRQRAEADAQARAGVQSGRTASFADREREAVRERKAFEIGARVREVAVLLQSHAAAIVETAGRAGRAVRSLCFDSVRRNTERVAPLSEAEREELGRNLNAQATVDKAQDKDMDPNAAPCRGPGF